MLEGHTELVVDYSDPRIELEKPDALGHSGNVDPHSLHSDSTHSLLVLSAGTLGNYALYTGKEQAEHWWYPLYEAPILRTMASWAMC